MGWAGPGPVDKSEGFGGPGRPRTADKGEGLGRAWPAQAQPIEVRGFGVMGPGPAGPPDLANPHLANVDKHESAVCQNFPKEPKVNMSKSGDVSFDFGFEW